MPLALNECQNASGHHGNNDDGCQRLDRGQGPVPLVPKLNHVLASRESAPTIDKIRLQEERTGRSKKAMLLIVARFFSARQGDLCGTDTQVARVFGARISGDAPDRVSVPDDVHQGDGFF
ncbi:hypothetical protein [Bradyrhizobium diazoefficiens]|uniref:hypothetical protein n=1 Tax=Bradyrhizobium diazoefficiens TaxID=1355477 RepID=UPI001B3D10AB|nr:hypothetical protein [Bradyrhizobium japonicum]